MRSSVVVGLATVAFVAAILLITRLDDGWVATTVAGLAFMGVVVHQSVRVQPRLMARRHALEAERDPVAAARARRRERLQCRLGLAIGSVCGMGGLILGLVMSGRT